MKKTFIRYVFPSMIAFVFSGLYAMVDAFFVGRNVGDSGLAAINIAYPMVAFVQSVGTGIGIGGAVYIATCIGNKDARRERDYLLSTVIFLAAAAVALTALILLTYSPLLTLFGAHGAVHESASDYITVIIAGAAFQVFSTGLVPILRNYGQSFLAMLSMVLGFVTNIVLDWLFVQVLKTALTGAALATIIGQAATVVPCAVYLIWKKRGGEGRFTFSFRDFGSIARVGLSPFGVTLCPNIGVIIMNRVAYEYGGDPAVAAYAVIAYVYFSLLLIMQGIGDGSQPLISRHYGMGELKNALTVRRYAFTTSLITAAVLFAALFFTKGYIPVVFGAGEEAAAIAEHALPYFGIAVCLAAVNRICTAYFYSVKSNALAYTTVYGEVACLAVFAVIFPMAWGLDGLWIANPASQAVVAVLGTAFCIVSDRKQKRKFADEKAEQ